MRTTENQTGAPVTGTNELFRVVTYIDGTTPLTSFDITPIAFPGDLVVVRGGKCTGKSNFVSLLAAACISSEPIGGRLCIPSGKKINRRWTESEVGWLREHYPDMPTADCAAYLGRTYGSVRKRAYVMGVTKSERYMKEVHYGAEAQARRTQARAAVLASEHRRWLFDLPQKTRFHFSNQTATKMTWRYHMRKAGYIEFKDDKNRMYYTDGQTRRPRLEASAKRHNVVVLPLSERRT